jgi:hypothetical protein
MKQRSIQAFAAYLFTGLQPTVPPDLQESGLNLKFDFIVADLGKQKRWTVRAVQTSEA